MQPKNGKHTHSMSQQIQCSQGMSSSAYCSRCNVTHVMFLLPDFKVIQMHCTEITDLSIVVPSSCKVCRDWVICANDADPVFLLGLEMASDIFLQICRPLPTLGLLTLCMSEHCFSYQVVAEAPCFRGSRSGKFRPHAECFWKCRLCTRQLQQSRLTICTML